MAAPARPTTTGRRREAAPRARTVPSAPPPGPHCPASSSTRAQASARRGDAAHADRPQRRRDELPLRVRAHEPLRHPDARALAGTGAAAARSPRRSAACSPTAATTSAPWPPTRPAGDQREPHLHHQPPADRRHALARRAAHDLGRGDRGLRDRLGHRRQRHPGRLERQDFPFAGPFSSIGCRGPAQGGPLAATSASTSRAVLGHPAAGADAHRRRGDEPG